MHMNMHFQKKKCIQPFLHRRLRILPLQILLFLPLPPLLQQHSIQKYRYISQSSENNMHDHIRVKCNLLRCPLNSWYSYN
jgi:hypothetical protein